MSVTLLKSGVAGTATRVHFNRCDILEMEYLLGVSIAVDMF
jgi:hypothetical protein